MSDIMETIDERGRQKNKDRRKKYDNVRAKWFLLCVLT